MISNVSSQTNFKGKLAGLKQTSAKAYEACTGEALTDVTHDMAIVRKISNALNSKSKKHLVEVGQEGDKYVFTLDPDFNKKTKPFAIKRRFRDLRKGVYKNTETAKIFNDKNAEKIKYTFSPEDKKNIAKELNTVVNESQDVLQYFRYSTAMNKIIGWVNNFEEAVKSTLNKN